MEKSTRGSSAGGEGKTEGDAVGFTEGCAVGITEGWADGGVLPLEFAVQEHKIKLKIRIVTRKILFICIGFYTNKKGGRSLSVFLSRLLRWARTGHLIVAAF